MIEAFFYVKDGDNEPVFTFKVAVAPAVGDFVSFTHEATDEEFWTEGAFEQSKAQHEKTWVVIKVTHLYARTFHSVMEQSLQIELAPKD